MEEQSVEQVPEDKQAPHCDLGILLEVDPIEVWWNEARDFTPWRRDNIDLLGAELGINFDTVTTEERVGKYYADIWAKEEPPSKRGVVIENQLSESDHDHLGKLLTYGAGLQADILVWIAERFRSEHLDAINSLNQTADGRKNYFAVQLEVFRIGDSQPAPFFRVLAKPANWTGKPPPSGPSPRMKAYQDFFERFLGTLKETDKSITRMSKTYPASWLGLPTGRIGFTYSCAFTRTGFKVELSIDDRDVRKNKERFDELERERADMEPDIGMELSWERLEDAQSSRIATYVDGSIDYNPETLDQLSEWAVNTALRFRDVFGERIKRL